MKKAARRGAVFYVIAPLRDDMPEEAGARWLPIRPGTDVALMLALAHTLLVENLWDSDFVARYCTGFEIFSAICSAATTTRQRTPHGRPRSPAFPLPRSSTSPAVLPRGRTLITVSHSLQRAQYGEQPVWMGACSRPCSARSACPAADIITRSARSATPAAGSMPCRFRRCRKARMGSATSSRSLASPTCCCIRASCSNITAARCIPGYQAGLLGGRQSFPSPPGHQPAAARLHVPQTIVVHESAWTPMAKFADIVLPATMTLERDDIGAAGTDPRLIAMRRRMDPVGEARDDFDIFAALSRRWASNRPSRKGAQPAMAGASLRADAARACRCRLGCA